MSKIREPPRPFNATLIKNTPGLANACVKYRKDEGIDLVTKLYGDKVLMVWPHLLHIEATEK